MLKFNIIIGSLSISSSNSSYDASMDQPSLDLSSSPPLCSPCPIGTTTPFNQSIENSPINSQSSNKRSRTEDVSTNAALVIIL